MIIFPLKEKMKTHINSLEVVPKVYISFLNDQEKHRFTFLNDHVGFFKKINKLKLNGRYYIDEMLLNGRKRKPYLDLEKIYPDEKTYKDNYKTILTKLQKDIIKIFKSEYKEKININDILILDSSGKVNEGYKMSYHIVISPSDRTLYYTEGKYSESAAYHLLTSLLDLDPVYKDYLDDQVYRSDATLRIIGSYKKFNCNRFLKPIDNKSFKPIELNDEEKLNYLLTFINKTRKKLITPLIEQTVKSKKQVTKNTPTTTNINEKLMSLIIKHHPTAKHNGLYNDIYHNFNYTDRNELCPISGIKHTGSNGFYVFETSRGFFMKCHSSKCEKSKYIGYIDPVDDFIESAEQIEQKYLITEGEINEEPIETVKELIKKWLSNEKIKTMAIRSAMGTGKTTMIKKILTYDKSLKKILWITHRQTLTKQVYGSFKKFGFESYMNLEGNLYDHDRIIVQIDSILRITKYNDDYNLVLKQYDLVIIDEIEGNLNHYSSPFLKNPDYNARHKFKFMTECIDSAKKLLVLDADLGMRTKLFINNFEKSIVVNNNYKPIEKTFTITNNQIYFNKNIFEDIKNKKNVCVISMTATYLDTIENKLKESGCKYIIHTSASDDKLKDKLENVNEFWKEFQFVGYSPTIESGVDFNENHFDKIYCVIKNGPMTCSQRAFLQMVGRIRQIKNPNILCFYKGNKNICADFYTYNDVLNYFRYYEKLNKKRILENMEYDKQIVNGEIRFIRKNNISLFDHISIYNEVENLNKNPKIFMTVLNKLIQKSGHKIKMDNNNDNVKNEDDILDKIDKGKLLSNIDETKYKISDLMKKQSQNKLTKQEKLILEKHFFKKTFGIKSTKNKKEFENFYEEFHDKDICVKRFENYFQYKNNYDNDTEIDDYNNGKEKVRQKIVTDFLNIILSQNKKQYKCNDICAILTQNDYENAIDSIAKNSIYYKDEESNRALFSKKKLPYNKTNHSNKSYMNTIKSVLQSYGIEFERGKRRSIKGKLVYDYSLSVNEQIKDIVDCKYGIIDTIDDFSSLF
ncbi:hypothetical protein [Moumouvirus maliensis]|nr:hypothetical protein [Moumouvirus maliensis]